MWNGTVSQWKKILRTKQIIQKYQIQRTREGKSEKFERTNKKSYPGHKATGWHVFNVSTIRVDCDYLKMLSIEMTLFSCSMLGYEFMSVRSAHFHCVRSTNTCEHRTQTQTIHFRLCEYENYSNASENSSEKVGNVNACGDCCAFGRRKLFMFEKDFPEFRTWIAGSVAYVWFVRSLRMWGIPLVCNCVYSRARVCRLCQCISFFSRSNMSSINFLFHLLSKISISPI